MMPRLRLTPFEEYMLLDSRPAYPMSCFLKLTFRGLPDLETLERALPAVLERHPLLLCRAAEDRRGGFYWETSETSIEIRRAPPSPDRFFPSSPGIDLLRFPALKIAFRDEPEGGSLVFELHHSACDAAGAERFIGDLLLEYSVLRGGLGGRSPREPVDPALLPRRADFRMSAGELLRNIPGYLRGLPRVVKFLRSRVLPLSTGPASLQTAGSPSSEPASEFPAVLARRFDTETTAALLQRARQRGVTINDLLLQATFLAMRQWQRSQGETDAENRQGVLRIAVPMNLRTEQHRLTPAANIVSMVFMDRQPGDISDDEAFLAGVHGEMEYIKRRKLGLTFLRGLSIYRRFFGSLSKMVDQDRSWTTATVSNLGPIFRDLPFPRSDDALQIEDGLELVAVDSVPPIRHLSALGLCVLTFAGRMTIDMQYDTAALTPEQADLYFDLFLRYFTDQASAGK